MKKSIITFVLLASIQSMAAGTPSSTCIIRNDLTNNQSETVKMIDINTYEDQLMNTQEVSFEDLKVVFTNGTRRLEIYRNGIQLGEVRATPMRRSSVALSINDAETGKRVVQADCNIFVKGL